MDLLLSQLMIDAQSATVGSAILVSISLLSWYIGHKQLILREDSRFVKETNPPAVEKFATKDEVKTVDGKVDKLREDMANEFRIARDASALSRQKLYEKINGIGENVAAIKERNDLQSAQITNIDRKVDRLLTKGDNA